MMSNVKRSLFLIVLVVGITSCKRDKAKILIIGDSISIGYTQFVRQMINRTR